MSLKSHSLTQEVVPPKISAVTALMPTIEKLSESELGELRHEIDLRLRLELGALNLADELALQFRQAKNLLYEVSNDKDTPVNQKAQILNSARAQLSEIVRQQESVWSMGRLKKYEVAFVKAASMFSVEQRNVFFDLYGEYLKDENADAPVPTA